ncbi:CapA family protein [Streptomyces hygroscopicus]|uniref:CapA family protein n=1 Tax=Streptomyces hygroscopicus TaxID=1912 RepID=UPI0033C68F5C
MTDRDDDQAPTWTADPLRALGIGVVPLATNHALDHGTEGLPSSPDARDPAGVRQAGGRTLAGDGCGGGRRCGGRAARGARLLRDAPAGRRRDGEPLRGGYADAAADG